MLKPLEEVQAEIAGKQVHSYQVALEAGQYLSLIIEQGITDLAAVVIGPDGDRIEEIDGRWHGPESVSLLASRSGLYQVQVRPIGVPVTARPYALKIVAIGTMNAADEQRMAAERLSTTAKPLVTQPNPASQKVALAAYQKALALWQAVGDRYGEAQTLNSLGFVTSNSEDTQSGLAYFDRALAIWTALDSWIGQSETLNNIATVHSRTGRKRQAIPYFERAVAASLGRGSAGELYALNNLGTVHGDLGDARKALEYFERVRSLFEAAGDPSGLLAVLNNISAAYDLLGESDRALEFSDKGLALCRKAADAQCAATMLLNRATMSRRLGDHDRALRGFAEAAQLANKSTNQRLYALAVLGMGTTHQERGDWDAALARYSEALPILEQTRDPRGEGIARLQIGEIHRERRQYETARQHIQQGLQLMQAVGDARNEAQAYHEIALIEHALANPSGAAANLERALSLARASRDVHNEARMLLSLGMLKRDVGDFADAKAILSQALQLIEGVRARVSRPQLRTSYLASKLEYYHTYIDVLMRLHAAAPAGGFDLLALETSERARARTLIDLLRESRVDVREGVDPALLERERSLRQLLNAQSDKQLTFSSAKQTAPAAAELSHEIDKTIAELAAVEAEIRSRSPRYAALTQPKWLAGADLRREILDPDTVLLEYSLGRERSYVWALSSDDVVSGVLPARAVIEQAARRLYRALTARGQRAAGEAAADWLRRVRQADAEIVDAAAEVSRLVLAPVAAGLSRKRLVIVTDGALAYLPFAALPDPNAGGSRPLMISHEIVTAPSASVLALSRRDTALRAPPRLTLAMIADPVFESTDARVKRGHPLRQGAPPTPAALSTSKDLDPSMADSGMGSPVPLTRLLGSRREVELIRPFAPGEQRLEALDFDANLSTAMSPTLANYGIVHFATHTLVNTTHPELSGIVLSLVDRGGAPQPGFLRLHDIYNLQLPIDLVVLSACQTALGQEISGEGLIGLSRGFMYAGVPRIIATLWKIDDDATAELMRDFYRARLRAGMTPAAALRDAQLTMSRRADRRNPFYWAGFVIQGEWR